MPLTTTSDPPKEVQHAAPVCTDAVAQSPPAASGGLLAWLGNHFAMSLIHLVGLLWWVFVIALLVWSYVHSLVIPPRAAGEE